MTHCHWHHTEDGGEGSHEDWAETALGCCHGCTDESVAAFTEQTHHVDEHNTILHNDTDEHHTTEHRHDVEVGACDGQCQDDTREGEWHGNHDDEWIGEALELSCHHDEDEEDDENGKSTEVAVGILLVFVRTSHLYGHTTWYFHFVNDLISQLNTIGEGITVLEHGTHRDDTLTVLALDGWSDVRFRDGGNVAHLHISLWRRNQHVVDVVDGDTCTWLVANEDVVFFSVLAIIAHQGTCDEAADRRCSRTDANAELCQFLTLEIHNKFWREVGTGNAGLSHHFVFLELSHHLVSNSLGVVQVVAVDFEGSS